MSAGTVAVWAMKDNDYEPTEFAGTTVGLQAAIDFLAGGKGKVFVGPGTLLTTTAIWIHSYCHLQGSGIGKTIIKRSVMTDADGNNTGAVLSGSPYGSNGTIPIISTPLYDVSVSDITLDGNYSAFTITATGLNSCGLRVDYADGLRVSNVRCQNCLFDGYRINTSRNVYLENIETHTVGQSSLSVSRNAVSFYCDASLAGEWGYNLNVNGASLVTTGDEAFSIACSNLVTISDIMVDGCDFVFELSNAAITPSVAGQTYGNWSISNISAKNCLDYFFTFSPSGSDQYKLVTVSNCNLLGHSTLHDGGAVTLPSTSTASIADLTFDNCVFGNINTKDTTTHHWVDSQPGTASGHNNIRFADCSFYGKSGSTRTGAEVGFNVRGSHTNVVLDNVVIRDIAGTGVRIHDTSVYTSPVTSNIYLRDVVVDGANDYGFRIGLINASSTAAYTELFLDKCVAKNTNKQTSGAGFWLQTSQAGVSMSGIHVRGCRAYKTTGTTMTHGVNLQQSAGTLDEIEISDCDFRGVQTAPLTSSGTITNVHFTPRTGKGTAIASAATIAIPTDGDAFHVTGTTNITNGVTVNHWDNGRIVTLIFDDVLTMSDTGTSKLTAAYVTSADDTLTLRCDGTNWFEVSRSAN